MTLTSFIFLSIAAACWAVCSHYTFQNRSKYKFGFWGEESYKRKYARSTAGDSKVYWLIAAPANWYYRIFKIKYKERFPLSATVFVFLTDGYHLTQWIMIKCIIASITLELKPFLLLWAVWLLVFNYVYVRLKHAK